MTEAAGFEVRRWTGPALPAGVDVLVAEAVRNGHAWAADFEETWRKRPFTDEGEALFLASDASGLLAMAVISADPFVADDHTGRLRYIYVLSAARRRGIAERLVRECLAVAGRWRRLRLHTDNAAAARLYERYGFRADDRDPRATHVRDVAR